MRSDVPIGVLLSGGLDSSLLVACAARSSSQPIKTFTMGLPNSKLDETRYANIVSEHFGTKHHVINLAKPSLQILDELMPYIDEPIADSSIIPSYMIYGLTAQHVKVALGGDGGDELFGGYSDYTKAVADNRRIGWLPMPILRVLASAAGTLPTGLKGRNRISALKCGAFQSLVWGTPYFDSTARKRILRPELVEELGAGLMEPELFLLNIFQTGQDPIDSMTRTHFGSILPDDFLVKVDRMSMAASMEVRAPLLDLSLVEFAFGRLPSEWKVCGKQGRRMQTLLGKRMLPGSLNLERKQGFSIPLDEWIRQGDRDYTSEFVSGLDAWINRVEFKSLVSGHMAGRANGSRLFSLKMLSTAINNLL